MPLLIWVNDDFPPMEGCPLQLVRGGLQNLPFVSHGSDESVSLMIVLTKHDQLLAQSIAESRVTTLVNTVAQFLLDVFDIVVHLNESVCVC